MENAIAKQNERATATQEPAQNTEREVQEVPADDEGRGNGTDRPEAALKTISRLEETCRMLKVKLGLPDSWTPREDILDDAIKTETQRLRESLAKAEKSSRDSVWAERKKIAALQRLLSQANDKVRRLKAVVSKNGEHQMLIMQKTLSV